MGGWKGVCGNEWLTLAGLKGEIGNGQLGRGNSKWMDKIGQVEKGFWKQVVGKRVIGNGWVKLAG